MIYVLEGEVLLHEGDALTPLRPGNAATFKAGVTMGHCLENTSAQDARYLVIGTRSTEEVVTYPDDDRDLRATGNPRPEFGPTMPGERRQILTSCPETALNEKDRARGAALVTKKQDRLLDLAFLVFDMLADNRVVFTHHHLFSHRTGVFLGHIEMASISGRIQTNFHRCRFRHWSSPAGPPPLGAGRKTLKSAF